MNKQLCQIQLHIAYIYGSSILVNYPAKRIHHDPLERDVSAEAKRAQSRARIDVVMINLINQLPLSLPPEFEGKVNKNKNTYSLSLGRGRQRREVASCHIRNLRKHKMSSMHTENYTGSLEKEGTYILVRRHPRAHDPSLSRRCGSHQRIYMRARDVAHIDPPGIIHLG